MKARSLYSFGDYMLTKEEYIAVRVKYFGESENRARKNFGRYSRAKKAKMHTHSITVDTMALWSNPPLVVGSLAPCAPAPCQPTESPLNWYSKKADKKQKEENLMNYASASISTPATETQDQRKYLERRLQEVYNDRRDGLEAKFGLVDDDAPSGPKELAERLAAGKYIIRGTGDDAKNAERYRYWTGPDLIQWRDPAKKADQAGFDAARADLKAKRLAALDVIKIDEPKAGLDAVKTLEAWEPTGAAN